MEIKPVARIYTDFPSKFGIPRQSGLCSAPGRIVFEPEYRNPDYIRGLENFSHIWLIWEFSENRREEHSPTVRPPRLGGNTRIGVFATRSPFRPNDLGLSCVSITSIDLNTKDGPVIYVKGADLMDGTPIYDIKPYIPYADCIMDASEGFAPLPDEHMEVFFEDNCDSKLSEDERHTLKEILSLDPRPHYQNDARIYGFSFAGREIKFQILDKTVHVKNIE